MFDFTSIIIVGALAIICVLWYGRNETGTAQKKIIKLYHYTDESVRQPITQDKLYKIYTSV